MAPRKHIGKKGWKRRSKFKKGLKSKKRYAATQGQIANVKQTVSLITGKQRFNALYTGYNISLATSTRAIKVAEAYQEYRISRVVFKFKPQQDTFIGSATGSVPYMHALVDRVGSFRNGTTLNFRSMRETGCLLKRFDEKNVVVSFKPAVLVANTDNTYAPLADHFSGYKLSPWLNTNTNTASSVAWSPNSVDHGGIIYGVEQDTTSTTNIPYDVDIDIYYQFRKPRTMTVGLSPINGVHDIDFDEAGADIQK